MKQRVIRGLLWQGGTTLLARGTRAIAVLVLARLLTPSDFGAFAALYALVEGLILLAGMGLGEALVVRREDLESAADVTFILSVSFGIVCFVIAWCAAPAVGPLFHLDGAEPILRALAVLLLIHALRAVPLRLFERSFDFRAKLLPTGLGAVAYLFVAVALAAAGRGVWSFVGAVLVGTAIETAYFWVRSSWRPRWKWSGLLAREALSFGAPVVFGGLLIYFFSTIDRVALAYWGGTEGAGPYAFAFTLAALPATLNASIAGTVLLPSYGALSDDPQQRLALHLRAAKLTAGFAVLFALLVVGCGGDFLRIAYGDKWLAAIPILQCLAVAGFFRSLAALVGDFLVGIGRPGSYQMLNGIQFAVAVVGVPIGYSRGGAVGVAAAIGAGSAVALLFGWARASSILGVPFTRFLSCLAAPLGAGLTGAFTLVTTRLLLLGSAPAVVMLVGAMVATFAYATAWWFMDASLRRDAKTLLARFAS